MSDNATEDRTITVSALSKTRTFDDVEHLAGWVSDVLEARGGVLSPLEIAAVQALAEHANGEAPPEVHRIARKTRFHSPTEPGRAERLRREGPYGERIAEAEARVQEARAHEAEKAEAKRGIAAQAEKAVAAARDGSGSAKNAHHVAQVSDQWEREYQAAAEDHRDARRELFRATARLNALRIAADRHRYEQEARFVHDGEAVTLQELQKIRER